MRTTPLSRFLDSQPRETRVTPLHAFKLARSKWLHGERIDIGKLASELGVGRATVFRWVGTREDLYGEVCFAGFQGALARAQSAAQGQGVDRLIDLIERLLRLLATSTPLRKFVAADPEFALRVLTSRDSLVQRRCTLAVQQLIDELADAGKMRPALPSDELAYVIVRITEAFLYRDVIAAAAPDIESAIHVIRILLTATPKHAPAKRAGSHAASRRRR